MSPFQSCQPQVIPPEDLVLKKEFIDDNLRAFDAFVSSTNGKGPIAIVGFVDRDESGNIFNAAGIVWNGKVFGTYHKILLPNYGVFDERRYFTLGGEAPVFRFDDICFGMSICEDIWHPSGPSFSQSVQGAQLIISINSSPYHVEKWKERLQILRDRSNEAPGFYAYVNLVGGQDELVFDGHSLVIDPRGELIARGPSMSEDLVIVDISLDELKRIERPAPMVARAASYVLGEIVVESHPGLRGTARSEVSPSETPSLGRIGEIYAALVLGTRDYVRKNGFKGVLLGLSGGVDSALTAAIAVSKDVGRLEQVKEHIKRHPRVEEVMTSIWVDEIRLCPENFEFKHLGKK